MERGEFINVGAIVSCPRRRFLQARVELDERRLTALDPFVDLESLRAHLESIVLLCAGGEKAGPIGQMSQRERFHWLVAPRSTIIQTSPAHAGWTADPAAELDRLLDAYVRPPA